MADVLIVDDEQSIREFLEILLRRLGHRVRLATEAHDAIAKLSSAPVDLVLSDLRLPKGSGMDVLRWVTDHQPDTQVIMMTAFATTENAVDAMKLGAYDYVIKPFKVDELSVVIERALERKKLRQENTALKSTLDARTGQNRLIGQSRAMRDVFDLIGKVAPTRTTVLLTGESGTGKELVARAIHARSPRASEPFVPINCGAIPESLIESELFGHVKGAFTGAQSDKPGLFEAAGKGTVFLDEIGELPLQMQVRLLRVLQERKSRRVGGNDDTDLDCRIVAATNRNLSNEVTQGRFREDLYFRLNVIEIGLPSLRDRHEDIPMLADGFVAKFAEEQASPVKAISDDAMRALCAYEWPGNVRELENIIERGVTLASGASVTLDDLPFGLRKSPTNGAREKTQEGTSLEIDIPDEGVRLEHTLERIERRYIELAIERTQGRKKRAAALLGLTFRSFRYRVAKLGIHADDAHDDSAEEQSGTGDPVE
jgi:two-component system response regulator PilR (NtrC family)